MRIRTLWDELDHAILMQHWTDVLDLIKHPNLQDYLNNGINLLYECHHHATSGPSYVHIVRARQQDVFHPCDPAAGRRPESYIDFLLQDTDPRSKDRLMIILRSGALDNHPTYIMRAMLDIIRHIKEGSRINVGDILLGTFRLELTTRWYEYSVASQTDFLLSMLEKRMCRDPLDLLDMIMRRVMTVSYAHHTERWKAYIHGNIATYWFGDRYNYAQLRHILETLDEDTPPPIIQAYHHADDLAMYVLRIAFAAAYTFPEKNKSYVRYLPIEVIRTLFGTYLGYPYREWRAFGEWWKDHKRLHHDG
jgi:hypothetical protein